MSAKKVKFDTLRSIAFGSISGTYAALGGPLSVNSRIMCLTNKTQGDIIVSIDSSNADGNLFIPAGSFKLFDFTANLVPGKDDSYVLEIGTQFYVKQVTAPTSGSVYLEVLYA
jgi:hypothetical protein